MGWGRGQPGVGAGNPRGRLGRASRMEGEADGKRTGAQGVFILPGSYTNSVSLGNSPSFRGLFHKVRVVTGLAS